MKEHISYLTKLSFDSKLYESFHAKYVTQIRLVLLLILSIVAIGLFGYLNLPRRLNPEIEIPIVSVTTVLPGAAPQDVESLVTIPLEDKLNDIKGIDTMSSSSQEGVSNITMQFLSTVDAEKAKADVQSAVDTVTDLPGDARDPIVVKFDFENQPIWTFALTTNSDYVSLTRFAEILEKKIEALPKVDKVEVSGKDSQQIEVIIDPAKANEYGINPALLAMSIQKATSSYPAGSVQTGTSAFAVTIDKEVTTIDDIRAIRLTVGGKSVRVGDIATVAYRSKANQAITYFASPQEQPKPAMQFFVYKSSTANIDAAEHDVRLVVEDTLRGQSTFSIVTVENAAEEITEQFSELTRDFLFTIVLVFILLLIFLGLRQAVISSITVPLTFLSTFAILNALGMSLNFLTMFAFLIALGLLIDDTIVTVAAMTRYYGTGRFTPAQTGILVWKDFIVPLWSTTITTIWAFLPLLLATGIIGEFIKYIPIVVTATMLSSTSIAVLITLPLMIVFLKPVFPPRVKILLWVIGIAAILISVAMFLPKNPLLPLIMLLFSLLLVLTVRIKKHLNRFVNRYILKKKIVQQTSGFAKRISSEGLIDIERVSHRYMQVIDRVLVSKHGKRNTLIAITIFAIVAYLLLPFGFIKNEFFPKQDLNLLYVTGELPAGTSMQRANQETIAVLNKVRILPEVSFVTAESGRSYSSGEGRGGGQNSFLLTVHLTEPEERAITSSEIAEDMRKALQTYTTGTITVQELSGGPPVGADMQITLLGDELDVLDRYANQIVAFLKKQPGVTNVNKSIKPSTSKLVFVMDKDKLIDYGLTSDAVALWMRTYVSGFTLDTLKVNGEEQDIVFQMVTDNPTPEDIGAIYIPTPKGSVALLELGKITLATNPTVITREEGKRTLSVTASVTQGYNVQEKNAALEEFAGTMKFTDGYYWKTGGVNEENQKSVNSILQAMMISFLLILITMVIEFRSFRQTFIALMIIPLSVAGVFYVFALTHTPLSFPALIGILALFGIVVTHAIVVIEKINDNIREGLPLKDAIVDAAGNRLEPVLLTSLATILGLIPVTISDPLWRGLGGAIIAGLLFSGLIKLFFVPVTYYLFFKEEEK